jgi:hypothetical protein
MTLKNIGPPRGLVLRVVFCLLFLLLFENNCSAVQWTMMFYMAADNDLFPQALIDIKELQKISGQPGIDIIECCPREPAPWPAWGKSTADLPKL